MLKWGCEFLDMRVKLFREKESLWSLKLVIETISLLQTPNGDPTELQIQMLFMNTQKISWKTEGNYLLFHQSPLNDGYIFNLIQ